MAKDPYKLLGVPKKASEAEIKSAYRKLAKKLHPDANPNDERAAERFKEISAAYTLLSDENMRAQYDRGQIDGSGQQQSPFGGGFGGGANPFGGGTHPFGGMGGGAQAGFGQNMDMQDLLSSLFGVNAGAQMGGMHAGNRRADSRHTAGRQVRKGADIRYKMKLSFMDSLRGGQKRIRLLNGHMVDVKIPKGVSDGQTLRIKGKGEISPMGGPSGDAKIEIRVGSHKFLSRVDDDLHLDLPISLREALLGGTIKIPLPMGTVQLKIPAGTQSGAIMRLRGKGVSGGDLMIKPLIHISKSDMGALGSYMENMQEDENSVIREKLLDSF